MANHKKILWVAGAILLAVSTAAFASNMGFKFVPDLQVASPGVYYISLPLNNNYADTTDIWTDMVNSCGQTGAGSEVTNFFSGGGDCTWFGTSGCHQASWNTAHQQESFRIRLGDAGSTCGSWVLVGSHKPDFIYVFGTATPDAYHVSIPYHTTAVDIEDIFNEIGASTAAEVTKFFTAGDCTWFGTSGCNLPIIIGEGLRVRIAVGKAPANWVPSHY